LQCACLVGCYAELLVAECGVHLEVHLQRGTQPRYPGSHPCRPETPSCLKTTLLPTSLHLPHIAQPCCRTPVSRRHCCTLPTQLQTCRPRTQRSGKLDLQLLHRRLLRAERVFARENAPAQDDL
jgi:hypothetical protein